MKKVYLIHGFESWPNRGFLPWLMSELFKRAKIFAVSLEMPCPELPLVGEWVKKINEEIKEPDQNKYLVGHSLGVPAILRYLESLQVGEKIGAVFLVAGFSNPLNVDHPDSDSDFRKFDNFFEKPFNFEYIKERCGKFYIIHGDKDHIVPINEAEILNKELGAQLLILEGAGHFQSSKVFELPELLELILKEVS